MNLHFKTLPYKLVEQLYNELSFVEKLTLYNWYVTTQLYNRAIETTTILKGVNKISDNVLYPILPYEEFIQTKGKELFHWYYFDLFTKYPEFRHHKIQTHEFYMFWDTKVNMFYYERIDEVEKSIAQLMNRIAKDQFIKASWSYGNYNLIGDITTVTYQRNPIM